MRVAAERIKHTLFFLFGRVFIKRHVWRERYHCEIKIKLVGLQVSLQPDR